MVNKSTPADAAKVWTLPNLLTVLRIISIAPFLWLIYMGEYGLALLIFFLASVTDFADGFIARKYGQYSALGRLLDPLADKLLTTAGFIIMAVPHGDFPTIPMWLAIAVVLRDVIILLGALVVNRITGYGEFKPTALGKINTFLELGLIVVFLGFHSMGKLTFLLPLCYLIVITSVIASGTQYVVEGVRILRGNLG